MNHLECPCGWQGWTIHALLEHRKAHGAWAVRFPDEKPIQPDPTRMNEQREKDHARYRRKVGFRGGKGDNIDKQLGAGADTPRPTANLVGGVL